MARAHFRDYAWKLAADNETIKINPFVTVTVYDAGTTTPIAQTLWADRSSVLVGDQIINPFSIGADGLIEFWLDLPDWVTLALSAGLSAGPVTVDDLPVMPDPSGPATFTSTVAATPALKATTTATDGLIGQFVGEGGQTMFLDRRGFVTLDPNMGIGLGTGLSSGLSKFSVSHVHLSGSSWVTGTIGTEVRGTGGDHGGFRSTITQIAASSDNQIRAGEFHASNTVKVTASKATWGLEVSASSLIASGSDTANTNVGVFCYASTAQWAGNGGAGVPQDAGFVAHGGYDRWKDYFRGVHTDDTIKFRVAGGVKSGDQDGDVVSAARIRTGNGTVSLPGWTFDSDLDSGVYRVTTNYLALATNGTVRMQWTDVGNVLIGTGPVATNATAGFPYIPLTVGAPTGTPTTVGGMAAVVWDGVNNKLMVYSSGWKGVTLS